MYSSTYSHECFVFTVLTLKVPINLSIDICQSCQIVQRVVNLLEVSLFLFLQIHTDDTNYSLVTTDHFVSIVSPCIV